MLLRCTGRFDVSPVGCRLVGSGDEVAGSAHFEVVGRPEAVEQRCGVGIGELGADGCGDLVVNDAIEGRRVCLGFIVRIGRLLPGLASAPIC